MSSSIVLFLTAQRDLTVKSSISDFETRCAKSPRTFPSFPNQKMRRRHLFGLYFLSPRGIPFTAFRHALWRRCAVGPLSAFGRLCSCAKAARKAVAENFLRDKSAWRSESHICSCSRRRKVNLQCFVADVQNVSLISALTHLRREVTSAAGETFNG